VRDCNYGIYFFVYLKACDLAEIIGTAIALKILFGVPITWGVAVTALDVLIIMLGSGGNTQKIFELLVSICVDSNCIFRSW
jgi:metal iron transporter